MFKDNLRCEPYITLLNTRQRITLCKFRCGNTNIPIVSGRYQSVNRSERTCNLCDAGVIGNAFHYIFKCKAFSVERKLYIPTSLRNVPSMLEMHKLFNSRNVKILLMQSLHNVHVQNLLSYLQRGGQKIKILSLSYCHCNWHPIAKWRHGPTAKCSMKDVLE